MAFSSALVYFTHHVHYHGPLLPIRLNRLSAIPQCRTEYLNTSAPFCVGFHPLPSSPSLQFLHEIISDLPLTALYSPWSLILSSQESNLFLPPSLELDTFVAFSIVLFHIISPTYWTRTSWTQMHLCITFHKCLSCQLHCTPTTVWLVFLEQIKHY